jgi:biopolymer transport protein ExbD
MKFNRHSRHDEVFVQMTPMIDIVFQLMVFFVFTFKIVLPEGDFNIRMPSAQQSSASTPSESPLLKVRLRADENGQLAGVQLGDVAISGDAPFYQLQSKIRSLIGDTAGPGSSDQEVEIDADFNLKYRYAMNAITAVTGYVDDNGEQHKLVERVRFSPLATQGE